jgi:hypothetical protein
VSRRIQLDVFILCSPATQTLAYAATERFKDAAMQNSNAGE